MLNNQLVFGETNLMLRPKIFKLKEITTIAVANVKALEIPSVNANLISEIFWGSDTDSKIDKFGWKPIEDMVNTTTEVATAVPVKLPAVLTILITEVTTPYFSEETTLTIELWFGDWKIPFP